MEPLPELRDVCPMGRGDLVLFNQSSGRKVCPIEERAYYCHSCDSARVRRRLSKDGKIANHNNIR
jgi:hypothetical protein